MRFILAFGCFLLAAASLARAEVTIPYSGTVITASDKPFTQMIDDLKAAIAKNKMGLVSHACATCGAKKIGVSIPGNQVLMVYHPRFAVRMLAASEAAGIEAPIRIYVTEQPDGKSKLTYRKPSHIFAVYQVADLDDMAAELDVIFNSIIKDAVK